MFDVGVNIFPSTTHEDDDTPRLKLTWRVILIRIAAIVVLALSVPIFTYVTTILTVTTIGTVPETIVANAKSDTLTQPQDGMVEVLLPEANSYNENDVLVVKADGLTFYYVTKEVYDDRKSS